MKKVDHSERSSLHYCSTNGDSISKIYPLLREDVVLKCEGKVVEAKLGKKQYIEPLEEWPNSKEAVLGEDAAELVMEGCKHIAT